MITATASSSPERKLTSPFDKPLKQVSQGCKQLVVGLKLWREKRIPSDHLNQLSNHMMSDLHGLFLQMERQRQLDSEDSATSQLLDRCLPLLQNTPGQLQNSIQLLLQENQESPELVEQFTEDVKRILVSLLKQLSQIKQAYTTCPLSPSTLPDFLATSSLQRDENSSQESVPSFYNRSSLSMEPMSLVPRSENESVTAQTASPCRSQEDLQNVEVKHVFLQMENETKRVQIASRNVTLSALRMLFVEHFQFHPGQHDFPKIYVHDRQHGIYYELQEPSSVENGSILKLWTELNHSESLKRHVDHLFVSVSKELKELKHAMLKQGPAVPLSPAKRNFLSAPSSTPNDFPPQGAKSPVKLPRRASLPPTSTRAVLFAKREDVLNLRRELGVLRQTLNDHHQATTAMIEQKRQEMKQVHDLFAVDLSALNGQSKRQLVDAGKNKLVADHQRLGQRFSKLSETLNDFRRDVTERGSYPSSAMLAAMCTETSQLQLQVRGLQDFVAEVKPIWKQTWENELQTIVKEQQLLKSHEEQLDALEEDLIQSSKILDQVRQVVHLKSNAKMLRPFDVKKRDEHHEGLDTVLREISTVEIDSSKRLQALERTERARQSAFAKVDQENPLAKELDDFVTQSKLKKTGGVDEVERLRKVREREVLDALLQEMCD